MRKQGPAAAHCAHSQKGALMKSDEKAAVVVPEIVAADITKPGHVAESRTEKA